MIEHFLSEIDAKRALTTVRKLAGSDLSEWAIAGGWAVEIHCMLNRQQPFFRPLTDIDFVVPAFDSIPSTLAKSFLFRHVHPFDPPGKTLLQMVDTETALRIDVFRAGGRTMSRTQIIELPTWAVRVVALEDVIAHGARILLDLNLNIPVPAKHARDYMRVSQGVPPAIVETAWADHRKPEHPLEFSKTDALVRKLVSTRKKPLITPQYSTEVNDVCPRCVADRRFPLADPAEILSVLGYC